MKISASTSRFEINKLFLSLLLMTGLVVITVFHLGEIVLVSLIGLLILIVLIYIPELTFILFISSSELWKAIFITESSVGAGGVWTYNVIPYSEWVTPVLLVLSVIGIIRKKPTWTTPSPKLLLFLLVFLVYSGLSLLWSPGQKEGLSIFARFVFLDMGAFFVAYALASKGYRNTRRLLLFYVLIGAIYALASNLVLLGSLLGFSTTTYSWSSQLFAGSWLNPARYLVACILILLAFLPEINKRYRVYVYIICALLMTTVITMNARTPLVSLIFCAGVVLWLSAQVVGLRPVKLMIVGLLVGIILFITLYTFLPGVASYLSRYQSTIISGQGFDNRWAFYQKFWEVWRAPVFGHGIGGWHAIAGSPHPHNMFLEVTFALGLIGLLIWITFIAMIWVRGLQPTLKGKLPNRYKMLTIAAVGGALNGFIASMSSGGFTDWRQQWVFWGILLALNSSMLDYFRRTGKKA